VRIVIDDAGDVPDELARELDIVVVPINITFGAEEYLTGISMDHAGFYAKVKEVGDHNFPKSSQPTPFQFAEYYREIMASGEKEILTITVGEKLSGTYESAKAAAIELADQGTFHLFDSAGGSAAQGYMAIEAARMARDGTGIDEIMKRLEEMRANQCVVFLVDSLEYAVKGGRVGSLQSTMASLLRIKPIMKVEDGLIVEAGRVRTYSKALDYIVDFIFQQVGEQPIKLAIIHAGSPDGAAMLQEMAKARLNYTEEFIADMGISVAINLGPGALGIVAIPE
jgi:DegV family protein with EDD domain